MITESVEVQKKNAHIEIWPGRAFPLGPSYDGAGTNFSLFSEIAEKVELCLFDLKGNETRVELPETTGYCWHGYLPNIEPGQQFGYRVYGPWEPKNGHRCNPAKLLLCPYAKAFEGRVQWNQAVFPYTFGNPDERNDEDSAPFVPKSIVTSPFFDWENDHPLAIPLHKTIIYEIHIKGFSKRNPGIPEDIRGTYSGLAYNESIEYLKKLGVTAVELMPIHQFVHDKNAIDRGLKNYWGYNSIGFFAPHNEYSSRGERGQQVQEFRQMVKTLHQAGIEVILDVVYNHTAEGNHLGPVFSFKGIDNASYYKLVDDDKQLYMDYTGTGNSLNMRHPHVLQLLMDSLRYWVTEMHVDGFRFDLASTLARELQDVNRLSAFFDVIQQDPIINQVKLIAEPWDVGAGGYQVGKFPPLWAEWNGKYRDNIREYWRGQDQALPEFASRITGSADLYENTGRRPYASINFITAHDGFTLHDLVSYNQKHNEDNKEDNKDGSDDNRSWNCGVEGPTANPDILKLRQQQKRNFLTTLFISQGIPMILGGDEIGRTQQGNNNAYCQDNEISWFDWENADQFLLEFTRILIAFRKDHAVFNRRHWFEGKPYQGQNDIAWYTPQGKEMNEESWKTWYAKSVGVYLNGQAIRFTDIRGTRLVDDSFFIMFNADSKPVGFTLPEKVWEQKWMKDLDTFYGWFESEQQISTREIINLEARSVVVLHNVT